MALGENLDGAAVQKVYASIQRLAPAGRPVSKGLSGVDTVDTDSGATYPPDDGPAEEPVAEAPVESTPEPAPEPVAEPAPVESTPEPVAEEPAAEAPVEEAPVESTPEPAAEEPAAEAPAASESDGGDASTSDTEAVAAE